MASGTAKIGHRYLNSYEYYRNLLKGNPLVKDSDWDNAYKNDSLDTLIAMTTSQDAPNLQTLEDTYGYDYLDAERRQIALYNEMYANRVMTDDNKIEETFLDENGVEQTRFVSEYDHTKNLLQQYRDIEIQSRKLQAEQQAKDEMNGFLKFGATALAVFANIGGGALDWAAGMYNLIEGGISAAAAAISGNDVDEAFRNAFNNKDFSDGFKDALLDFERNYTFLRNANGDYQGVGSAIGSVATSIGQMLPTMGLSYITAGVSSAAATSGSITMAQASNISSNIGKVSRVLFYTGMGSNTFKEMSREMTSIPTWKLLLNSTLRTVAEAGIEMALGNAFGPSNLDKMHFNNYAPSVKGKVSASVFKEYAKDFVSEGTEELLQEFSGYIVDEFCSLFGDDFGGLEELNLSTLIDAFVLGGLTTIATNTFSIITTKRVEIAGASVDANNKLRMTKSGKKKSTKLSQSKSWIYKKRYSELMELYEKYMSDKTLDNEQREGLLGEMYAYYRVISSFYGEIGEKRFKNATKLLDAIHNHDFAKDYDDDLAQAYEERYAAVQDLTVEPKVRGERIGQANADIDYIESLGRQEYARRKRVEWSKRLAQYFITDEILKADNTVHLLEKAGVTNITKIYRSNKKSVTNNDNTTTNSDNTTTNNDNPNNVDKVANECLNNGANVVIIGEDGQRPAEANGVMIIPEQLAKLDDVDLIYKVIAEDLLVDMLKHEEVFAPILGHFEKIYKEMHGEENFNMNDVIYHLLFDDNFFNIVLYSSNKETVRFLDSLGKTIDELDSGDYKQTKFKFTATNIYKRMKIQLIRYCVNQTEIVPETMKSLNDDEVKFVKNIRYSKDLFNRLGSVAGLHTLTESDKRTIERKINNAPVDNTIKEELRANIFSKNNVIRAEALQRLDDIYKNAFYGVYNDKIYKKGSYIGDVVLNQFLQLTGMTLETIEDYDSWPDEWKKEYDADAYGLLPQEFVSDKFLNFTNDNFYFDANLQVRRLSEIKPQTPVKLQSNTGKTGIENQTFLIFEHFDIDILGDIVKPIESSLKNYINITEIILNPDVYLDINKIAEVLSKNDANFDADYFKNTTVENPQDFCLALSQYLALTTNYGIVPLNNSEFTVMRAANNAEIFDIDKLRKFNNTDARFKLSDVLNKTIKDDALSEITVIVDIPETDKKDAYYLPNRKEIHLQAKPTFEKFIGNLNHETHHAYARETADIGGATDYKFSDDALFAIGENLSDDYEKQVGKSANKIVYKRMLGEMLANGELPLDVPFFNTKRGVLTPWGEELYFDKSGQTLITANDINDGAKTLYNVDDTIYAKLTDTEKRAQAKIKRDAKKRAEERQELQAYMSSNENQSSAIDLNDKITSKGKLYHKSFKNEVDAAAFQIIKKADGYETEIEKTAYGFDVKYLKPLRQKVDSQTDNSETKNKTKTETENKTKTETKPTAKEKRELEKKAKERQEFEKYMAEGKSKANDENPSVAVDVFTPSNFSAPTNKYKTNRMDNPVLREIVQGKKLTSEQRSELNKLRKIKKEFSPKFASTGTRVVSQKLASKHKNLKPYIGQELNKPTQMLLINFDIEKAKETASGVKLKGAKELQRLINSGGIHYTDVFELLRSLPLAELDDYTFGVINDAYFKNYHISTAAELYTADSLAQQAWALIDALNTWRNQIAKEERPKVDAYLSLASVQMSINDIELLIEELTSDSRFYKLYQKSLELASLQNFKSAGAIPSSIVHTLETFNNTIDSLAEAYGTVRKIAKFDWNLKSDVRKRAASLQMTTNDGDTTLEEIIGDGQTNLVNSLTKNHDTMVEHLKTFYVTLEQARRELQRDNDKNVPEFNSADARKILSKLDKKIYGDEQQNGMSDAAIKRDFLHAHKIMSLANFYTSRQIVRNYDADKRKKLQTKIAERKRLSYENLVIVSRWTNDELNAKYSQLILAKYSSSALTGFGVDPSVYTKKYNELLKSEIRTPIKVRKNVNAIKNKILYEINAAPTAVRTEFLKNPLNATYFERNSRGLIVLKDGILQADTIAKYKQLETEAGEKLPYKYKAAVKLDINQLLNIETDLQEIWSAVRNKTYVIAKNKQSVAELEAKVKAERNKRELVQKQLESTREELRKAKATIKTLNHSFGNANFNISYANTDYTTDDDAGYDTGYSVPKKLQKILSFSFKQFEKSRISFNKERNMIINGREFFKANAETLNNLTEQDIIDIIQFYKNTSINTATTDLNDLRKYKAFMLYIIQHFANEHNDPTSFLTLSPDLLSDIEEITAREADVAGTILPISGKTIKAIDPKKVIAAKLKSIAGVKLSDDEVQDMMNTIHGTDYSDANDVENLVGKFKHYYEKAAADSTNVPNFWDRLWRTQRMFMLSGPGTGIRNTASNVIVTVGDVISENLGELITKNLKHGHQIEGQWKIVGTKPSAEVENYARMVFVESGLIDYLNVATKYDSTSNDNEYEIRLANRIKASLNNKLFHDNQFKSPLVNKVSQLIYKMLDDSKFVKKRALKYYTKILEEYVTAKRLEINEQKQDLQNQLNKLGAHEKVKAKQITDAIKNLDYELENLLNPKNISNETLDLFVDAYDLATLDFMHETNIFSKLENIIRDNAHPAVFFLYKQVLPFAPSSWAWFKAGLKWTPVGLVNAIVRFNRLETEIAKAQERHEKDGTMPAPGFTQYLIKRDLGKGVIGSIGFGIGALLLAFGWADVDEEDYDQTMKLKIRFANSDVFIDISDVFGTHGIFMGMTFMYGLRKMAGKYGDSSYGFNDYLVDFGNQMFMDSTFADIFSLFRNDETPMEYIVNNIDDSLQKFVPNLLGTVLSPFYNGKAQYDHGISRIWQKFIARYVSPLAYTYPSRYDPYTGEKQVKYTGLYAPDWLLEAWNKLSPIKISAYKVSEIERTALLLGVRKKELTGTYDDVGQLDNELVSQLNKYYGELNSETLNKFVSNRISYKVKDEKTGKYVTLKYNKMTDKQKKSVIERIMDDNAKSAKVYVLTKNGYKYYGSESEIAYLKSLGIRNIYIETGKRKGFIK